MNLNKWIADQKSKVTEELVNAKHHYDSVYWRGFDAALNALKEAVLVEETVALQKKLDRAKAKGKK